MIRKRRDSDGYKRGALGISGTEDDNFSREHAVSPWSPPKIGDGKVNPSGHGKYTDDESGLRNRLPADPTGGEVSRDIWSEVEGQSGDGGNRAVKSRGQP
jgi:hypothetical protein